MIFSRLCRLLFPQSNKYSVEQDARKDLLFAATCHSFAFQCVLHMAMALPEPCNILLEVVSSLSLVIVGHLFTSNIYTLYSLLYLFVIDRPLSTQLQTTILPVCYPLGAVLGLFVTDS